MAPDTCSVTNSAIFHSTSVRLSLAYAGIVLFAFLVAAALIWIGVREAAEKEMRQYIDLEIHAIETELQSEGVGAAIAAIEARSERSGALEYWLTDAEGERLLGDLPSLQGPDGWRHLNLPEGAAGAEGRRAMLVNTTSLPNGMRLSVGEDLGRAEAFREAAVKSLAASGIFALVLCLAAGLLVTRRALQRMDALNSMMRQVAAGNLSARFPPGSGRDRTDVEEIGANINAMIERIEALVDGIRRVSRDVAHDLRTPLSHLQQRLERAREARAPEERTAAIEHAQQKLAEILQTFDAILRLAEIEGGAAKRRFAEVDLTALVERVADAYRPDIEESGRHVTLGTFASTRIVGDADLLAQALANLIENAIRHTPSGATITINLTERADSVVLEVVDDGTGIAAKDYRDVVRPFARLDASRSKPGAGLGLSIVSAVASLHGADLVLSDATPGLRVSLIVPKTAAHRDRTE